MADYQFVANGQLAVDAIKFYPRDDNGDFVSGVEFSLSGAKCAGASIERVREVTDNQGEQCLIADLQLPTSVADSGNCTLRASSGTVSCSCAIDFVRQIAQCPDNYDWNTGGTLAPGGTFQGVLVIVDQNGDQYVGEDLTLALSNNASLTSFDQTTASFPFTATAGSNPGDVTATITGGSIGTCTFKIAEIVGEPEAVMVCTTLDATLGSYTINQAGQLQLKIFDDNGDEITSGLTFTDQNAPISGATYTNGEWVVNLTPGASTWSVSLSDGTTTCDIDGTASAAPAIDCSSLAATFNNYTIDELGQVRFTVSDSNGDEITTGLTFTGQDATIGGAIYHSSNQWRLNFTPTASTWTINVSDGTNTCTIDGSTSVDREVDCTSVVCEVIGQPNPLVIGREGKMVVKVLDQNGAPVSAGVVFDLTGATLEQAAYSVQLEGWVLDITPTAATVVGTLLTSSLGNCSDFCSLTAVTRAIDCASITCATVEDVFENGTRQQIVVELFDTLGDPIEDVTGWNWTGGTVVSASYSPTLSAHVITMDVTADQVVGNTVATAIGTCNNFCTINTAIEKKCCGKITASNIPSAIVGASYSGLFLVEGIPATITGLPTGLSYNATTGIISGTVTEEGNSTITVTYGECSFQTMIAAIRLQTTSIDCCPKMTNVSLPTGIVGDPYAGFAVFSGNGARNYSAVNLPPGTTLNSATGQITGIPTTVGNYVVTYTVSDSRGTCTYSLTIDVDEPGEDCPSVKPAFTSIPVLVSAINEPVQLVFGASTGSTFRPIDLANGLSIDAGGNLRGTPTAAGVTAFTVTLERADGTTCDLNLVYTVLGAMGSATGDDAITSINFCLCCGRKTFITIGSTSDQYEVAGNLPTGMAMNGGALVGTPTTPGPYTFTIKPGNGKEVSVMILVEDCSDSPKATEVCRTTCDIPPEYWVKIIACVAVNGVEYKASMEMPTNPLRVDKADYDYLLAKGYAVACPDQEISK